MFSTFTLHTSSQQWATEAIHQSIHIAHLQEITINSPTSRFLLLWMDDCWTQWHAMLYLNRFPHLHGMASLLNVWHKGVQCARMWVTEMNVYWWLLCATGTILLSYYSLSYLLFGHSSKLDRRKDFTFYPMWAKLRLPNPQPFSTLSLSIDLDLLIKR